MTTQNISAIAVRFLAIWLLVKLIFNLPGLSLLFGSIESYTQRDVPIGVYISMVVAVLVVGLIASYLMYKSSETILSKTKDETTEQLSSNDHKFLIQLLGLYFIVTSITCLPSSLSFLQYSDEIMFYNLLGTLGWVFQLIVGLFLIGSPKYWTLLLNKLRGRV